MPETSAKLPKPASPTVDATSAKAGASSASTSLIVIAPVAVTGASPMLPSVTAPVTVPATTAASSEPSMVIVTVLVEDAPSLSITV